MALPTSFLDHLRELGYNSRSNKHSNALGNAIASDLSEHCPTISERAAQGALVYDLNFDLVYGTSEWNVDLVIGPPPPGTDVAAGVGLAPGKPSTAQIAMEFKSVMTEHRKAVKNRKRDFEAHHEHVHNYSLQTISAGILVVNIAETYQSSLRPAPTVHKNPLDLITHCVGEMRNVRERTNTTGDGIDAKAVIVLDMDNMTWPSTQFHESSPAPQVGNPLHYDAFIQRVCSEYQLRFG